MQFPGYEARLDGTGMSTYRREQVEAKLGDGEIEEALKN